MENPKKSNIKKGATMKTISIIMPILLFALPALAGEINLESPSSPFYDVILHESLGRKLGFSLEEIKQHNEAVQARIEAERQSQDEFVKEREKEKKEHQKEWIKPLSEIGRFQAVSTGQGFGVVIIDTKLGHVWSFDWSDKAIGYHGQIVPIK